MPLFTKYNDVTSATSVTPDEAVEIYHLFKAGYEPTTIFTMFGHKIKRSDVVKNEYSALEEEILLKARGQYTTESVLEIPIILEDGTNGTTIMTTTTSYTYASKEELLASMSDSTTLLQPIIGEILDDVILYNPSYDPTRTYQRFIDEI